jgi:ABC-type uncharacterized transport system involved in gliding motility auxiliary subunit
VEGLMANEWIKARQTKYGAYLFLYVLVIVAVLFAANWLAKDHNKSFDVTTNKRFTLSDQTKKVVGDLKKPLTVYYFDRKGQYDTAKDLLDRYHNLNASKVDIRYIDPEEKPDIAKIIIDNGVKKETAKGLTEEELTGAIIRDEKSGARGACFVEGSGEHRIEDTGREGYSDFKDALEKNNYKTSTISLLEKPEVPKTCNVVIVGGPSHDYVQPAVDALKTYITGGGHVLFNFDAYATMADGKMGDTPALGALVQPWGITLQDDVVLDLSAYGQARGPMNPTVVSYESHPITRVMTGNDTVFPFARSLDVKPPAEKLFSTSSASFAVKNARLPIETLDPSKADKGPFVLGAAATIGSGSAAGRVVVVGSSLWASNQILGAPIGNRDLLLNIMNWMTADEDLISIRPKEPEDRRLRIASSARFFWISVVILPLAIVFSGVSIWWKRR